MSFSILVRFLVLQFCLLSLTLCWGHTGHMLVSTVTKLTLLNEDKDAFFLAEKLSSILNLFSHNTITNFVESACWADDVKGHGLTSMDNWHFKDLPVRIPNIIRNNNITYTTNDALGTIHQAFKILTKWQKSEIQNLDTQFEKSFMARYLIHVVGDVHQPLHAASLFDDDKFRDGDQGGNLFKIQFNDHIDNLHKLYDSVIDRVNNRITRPLEIEDHDYIEKTAQEIMKDYTKEDLADVVNNLEFGDWLEESQSICQNFVYKSVVYGARPSDDFLNTSYDILRKRIALGGYRLAELFKKINKTYQDKKTEVDENKSGFLQQFEFNN